jgi:hypothetical protein
VADEDDEMGEAIRAMREEITRQKRRDGNLWACGDRATAEEDIARGALEALGIKFTKDRPHPHGRNFPPDWEAEVEGRRVGVEVTELVDQDVLHGIQQTNHFRVALWPSGRLRCRIEKIIRRKDAADIPGEPYARYILVIHTDEGDIKSETVAEALTGFQMRTALIDEAYLYRYQPNVGYQSFPIPLSRRNGGSEAM